MAKIELKQPLNMIVWFGALLGDYAMIAAAFLMAWLWGWMAYVPALLLLGIAQHRISVLGHEGVHGLISKNHAVNDWIAQIFCFWMLLTDLYSYREFHGRHHSHLGEEEEDPELFMKADKYHLPITRKRLFLGFITDMLGASIPEFIRVMKYFGKRDHPFWAPSFIALSGLASYWAGHIEFFLLYMVSKPTTFWAVFRLRIYTEHTDIPGTHRVYLTGWQRFLFSPHNIGIHWEHHNHPHVPFWQLPALRKALKSEPVITFGQLLRFGESKERKATRKAARPAPTFGTMPEPGVRGA